MSESESVIPAVLLRVLSEYKFVGHPLWMMADGKDHVRVELTFHKTLPKLPVYKRRTESRRQPAPSAGEWPRQPTAARRPPPTARSTHTARREPTAPEKETSSPAPQTLEINTPDTITVTRPPKTAQLTPFPYSQKPATPAPSPETPRAKRPRTKSPKYTTKQPTQYFHVNIENEYILHEKYDLQDVYATIYKVIIKATRQPRKDEELKTKIFQYSSSTTKKTSTGYKSRGATSKFYDDPWHTNIEMLIGATGVQETNTAYWYDVLEESCRDPLGEDGGPPLLRFVPPSYLGMTYSK